MPVRVFYWLLVISFAGVWLTAESEAQQMLHYAFGYAAFALILFRIVWGVIGTRYARFTLFIKGPTDTWHHIKSLLSGKGTLRLSSNLGHNPADALAMVSLMVLVLLISITGYWIVKDVYGDLMSDAHETIAKIALGVVIIHVFAAVIMSFMQKEYLVGILLVLAWAYLMFLIYSGAMGWLTR